MRAGFVAKKARPRRYIVYDLEFIGNIECLETCRIWEVAAQLWGDHSAAGRFEAICYPYKSEPVQKYASPVSSDHVAITQKWLQEHGALHKRKVLKQFADWLSKYPGACLISHNNHKIDKPVLEMECERVGAALPTQLEFMDSLPIFRKLLPGLGDWTLKNIHSLVAVKPRANHHRAFADVEMLSECLSKMTHQPLHGTVYKLGIIPLTRIDGVGIATERRLFQQGLGGVLDLWHRYKACNSESEFLQSIAIFGEIGQRVMLSLLREATSGPLRSKISAEGPGVHPPGARVKWRTEGPRLLVRTRVCSSEEESVPSLSRCPQTHS